MKTKEEILNEVTIGNDRSITDYITNDGYAWNIIMLAMQEYSDLTNSKLVEENEVLKECNNNKATYIEEMESELSAANERSRIIEIGFNLLRQMYVFDDSVIPEYIKQALTPKQHG